MNRPHLRDEGCTLLANNTVGPRLYCATFSAPRIAGCLAPGQFVHLHVPGMPDHLLRRPFSVYRIDPVEETLDIIYQVVGHGTKVLGHTPAGAKVSMIGPIGSSWQIPEGAGRVLLVGGGVGAAPLFMLAQQASRAGTKVMVVLGAQTKDALFALDDYAVLDVELVLATDDGSFGHEGFCTGPAQDAIEAGDIGYVACCGPEPLMRIVSGLADAAGIPCQVSMERRMACGVGACLSCVVETVEGRMRACVDGPIFDAKKVVW